MDGKVSGRIAEYDIAKGIGILLVIMGHILPAGNYIRTCLYSFHIPLFFFVSGLVITESADDGKILSLIYAERSLLVNYFFYSVVFCAFDFVIKFLLLSEITLSRLLWDVYLTIVLFGINVLWFLSTLVLGKILLRKLRVLYSEKFITLSSVLLLLGGGVLSNLLTLKKMNGSVKFLYYPIATLLRTLLLFPYLWWGYVLRNRIKELIKKSNIWIGGGYSLIAFALLVLLCRYSLEIDYHYMQVGFVPLSLVLAILGISMVLSISVLLSKLTLLRNVFCFYGKNSLFIMVTHEYLMLRTLISYVISIIWVGISDRDNLVITFIILITVETLLCKFIARIRMRK